jgi:hypothetical protein
VHARAARDRARRRSPASARGDGGIIIVIIILVIIIIIIRGVRVETSDSVLVFLDAYAALFECAGDAFLAGGPAAGSHWPAGQCTQCLETCVPGKPATGLAPSLQAEAALCTRGLSCDRGTARRVAVPE